MLVGTDQPSTNLPRRLFALSGRDGLPIIAAFAIAAWVASWLFCLKQGITSPLWLDESLTGAFAAEPSLTGLTEQVRSDANAPLYFYLMWFWARAFGVSNLSLHVPSLLLGIATPLVAWAGVRRSHPALAYVWAALLGSELNQGVALAG